MRKNKKNSSNSNVGEIGNTKQISPGVHWMFTFNNYSEMDVNCFKCISSKWSKICIFQEELGESGTPHLQGYIAFKTKVRPKKMFSVKIHWEKCRNVKQSKAYVTKNESRCGRRFYWDSQINNWRVVKMLKVISRLRNWQKKIIEIVKSEPDDRSIYWFYEKDGGIGKSALCKYIVSKFNALVVAGKCADMKYGIVNYINSKGYPPDVVIFDIPRSYCDYVSYTGMEEIKNGLFFSSKYESGMVCINSPHVICFANMRPEMDEMSKDRWKIERIIPDDEEVIPLLTSLTAQASLKKQP